MWLFVVSGVWFSVGGRAQVLSFGAEQGEGGRPGCLRSDGSAVEVLCVWSGIRLLRVKRVEGGLVPESALLATSVATEPLTARVLD